MVNKKKKKIERIDDITSVTEGWVTFTPNGNSLLIVDKTMIYVLMTKINEIIDKLNEK